MDERECVEHTAADQIGQNRKWWEWGDQEHIQRLKASHATGFTGSCQLNLSSEPVMFFLPNPTSHRAKQHAKSPAPSSPSALSLL